MKIAIIGTGNMGAALARRVTAAGHEVRLASRNFAQAKQLAGELGPHARALPAAEAVAGADLVIAATPYPQQTEALRAAGNLEGKTVVDISNPLTPDFLGLTLGFSTSALAAAPGPGPYYAGAQLGLSIFHDSDVSAATGSIDNLTVKADDLSEDAGMFISGGFVTATPDPKTAPKAQVGPVRSGRLRVARCGGRGKLLFRAEWLDFFVLSGELKRKDQ